MNTEDINLYLTDYIIGIRKTKWLNDYTSIIEFDSDDLCLKAFKELTSVEENPELNESLEKESNPFVEYNWKKARSYTLENREIEIQMRIAEEGDLDRKSSTKDAIFYKYYKREEIKEQQKERYQRRDERNSYRRSKYDGYVHERRDYRGNYDYQPHYHDRGDYNYRGRSQREGTRQYKGNYERKQRREYKNEKEKKYQDKEANVSKDHSRERSRDSSISKKSRERSGDEL